MGERAPAGTGTGGRFGWPPAALRWPRPGASRLIAVVCPVLAVLLVGGAVSPTAPLPSLTGHPIAALAAPRDRDDQTAPEQASAPDPEQDGARAARTAADQTDRQAAPPPASSHRPRPAPAAAPRATANRPAPTTPADTDEQDPAPTRRERTPNEGSRREPSPREPSPSQPVAPDGRRLWPVPTNGFDFTQAFGCVPQIGGWYPAVAGCPADAPVFHSGIDLAAPEGTRFYAAASGWVLEAGLDRDVGLANTRILIQHDGPNDDYATEYLHWIVTYVKPGDYVRAGQPIGEIGSVGYSTGPHLHFSVVAFASGERIDPLGWLPRGSDSGIYDRLAPGARPRTFDGGNRDVPDYADPAPAPVPNRQRVPDSPPPTGDAAADSPRRAREAQAAPADDRNGADPAADADPSPDDATADRDPSASSPESAADPAPDGSTERPNGANGETGDGANDGGSQDGGRNGGRDGGREAPEEAPAPEPEPEPEPEQSGSPYVPDIPALPDPEPAPAADAGGDGTGDGNGGGGGRDDGGEDDRNREERREPRG